MDERIKDFSRQRRYWWNDENRNLRFSLSCVCLSVCPSHKSNLASIFFFVPSFPATLSIFSFPNPIDGSVSPEQILCQSFFQRFSAIERFGPRFSSHDLRLLKSRLAVQSSQILTVRLHYADKLLESIEYERFQLFGKWVSAVNNHNARIYLYCSLRVLDESWIGLAVLWSEFSDQRGTNRGDWKRYRLWTLVAVRLG